MEILVELILTIIFEGSTEGAKTKRFPLWLRILCAIIAAFLFLFILGTVLLVAVLFWNKFYHIPSIGFLLLAMFWIAMAIKTIKSKASS